MALNLAGLKSFQGELESRSGGKTFFAQKNIGAETDVRILPSVPALNGMYFIEQIVYWINKKPYVSPATFGKPCPIEQELEVIKDAATKDADLKALLDSQNFSKRSVYLIPILLLDCKFDAASNPTQVNIVDNAPKVLQCGPQLMKAINRIATSRSFQNGTDDGFTDREKGFNLILTKKGSGLDTEYTCQGWRESYEMSEELYSKIPDVHEMTMKQVMPDDYLVGVVNNYFYGDPMPAKPAVKEPTKPAESTGRGRVAEEKPSRGRTVEEKPSRGVAPDPEPTEEKPRKARTATRKAEEPVEEKPKVSKGRNLMADLNNI